MYSKQSWHADVWKDSSFKILSQIKKVLIFKEIYFNNCLKLLKSFFERNVCKKWFSLVLHWDFLLDSFQPSGHVGQFGRLLHLPLSPLPTRHWLQLLRDIYKSRFDCLVLVCHLIIDRYSHTSGHVLPSLPVLSLYQPRSQDQRTPPEKQVFGFPLWKTAGHSNRKKRRT